MVGEKETSILRNRKESGTPDEGQQGTYSRRKKEKKSAKFQLDEDSGPAKSVEDQTMLVDRFVQEVIERAKQEYLRQCNNHLDNADTKRDDQVLPGNRKDHHSDHKDITHDSKKSKKSGSDKHKHRHHYKYSDPVDEKEISVYEQQEGSSLLHGKDTFEIDPGQTRRPMESGIYRQTLAALRRFLGCCVGRS